MRLYIKSHIYKVAINVLMLLVPVYYLISTILHDNDKYLPIPNPVTEAYAVTVIVNFSIMLIYYVTDLVLNGSKITFRKWLLLIYYLAILISGLITFMACKSSGL